MRKPVPFNPWRNHHCYYGIALFLFGLYNYYLMKRSGELEKCKFIWYFFMLLGAVMAIDDAIEHTVTRDTPIRILFEKLILPKVR